MASLVVCSHVASVHGLEPASHQILYEDALGATSKETLVENKDKVVQMPAGDSHKKASVIHVEVAQPIEGPTLSSEDEPIPTTVPTIFVANKDKVVQKPVGDSDTKASVIHVEVAQPIEGPALSSEDEPTSTTIPPMTAESPIHGTESNTQNETTDSVVAQKKEQTPALGVRPTAFDEPIAELVPQNKVGNVEDEIVVVEHDTASTNFAEPKVDEELTHQPILSIQTSAGDNLGNTRFVESPIVDTLIEEPHLAGSEDKPSVKVIPAGKPLSEPSRQLTIANSGILPEPCL